MKRVALSLVFGIFVLVLMSNVSGEIVINEQPKEFYNMGEVIDIPAKVVTAAEVNNFFTMNLICNGIESEVHKEYVYLQAGEEEEIDAAIPLITSFVGRTTGTCKIKAILGEQTTLTEEFEISNVIDLEILTEEKAFNPGDSVLIEGEAIRANGMASNGIANIEIVSGNDTVVDASNSVKKGYFSFDFTLPSDLAARDYIVNVKVYEIDFEGKKTNEGFVSYSIEVSQIPTSLEILFEDQKKEITPGEPAKLKVVLHDQTGEKMESSFNLTVEDEDEVIVFEKDGNVDEFFEIPIVYNQPPAEWNVYAFSEGLEAESSFSINEKAKISVDFINKTLVVRNIGNVPYNDTVGVNLGNDTLSFDIALDVDAEQKYLLSAPNGNYSVGISSKGEKLFEDNIALTGKAVGVKEASEGVFSLIRYPIVWIFVLFILGFVSLMLFRRSHNKTFSGKINLFGMERKKAHRVGGEVKEEKVSPKSLLINSSNKAEFSLSIKGDKQGASTVCLKIKNYDEIKSKKKNLGTTLDNLAKIAEDNKSMIYENGENIFFVLSAAKTKTFKNEKRALIIANEVKKILDEHNRLMKQKIDFGISVHHGTIIAKYDKDSLKFMSLGNFISAAKKLASISLGEVYVTKEAKDNMVSDVKAEKHTEDGMDFYVITDIRDREKNRKFIREFVKRMEKENNEKK